MTDSSTTEIETEPRPIYRTFVILRHGSGWELFDGTGDFIKAFDNRDDAVETVDAIWEFIDTLAKANGVDVKDPPRWFKWWLGS